MKNIDKFTEPTYYNHHNILVAPDIGFGRGQASGCDGYGCAHNRYTYYDGSGITAITNAARIGFGAGESYNNLSIINHEEGI